MSGIKEQAVDILLRPATGATAATTTTGFGLGTILEMIPSDIGKLASLVGIVLSLTIIYVHIARWRMDRAKEKRAQALENIQIERDRLELEAYRQRLSQSSSDGPVG